MVQSEHHRTQVVHMSKELHLKLTVRLFSDSDEHFFGPGIATLLHRIQQHHSLRAAAASMDMAYSKAWRIIRSAESVLGCPMLESRTGGHGGGGAVLTPEAERLLAAYDAYCKDVETFARSRFDAAFGDLSAD